MLALKIILARTSEAAPVFKENSSRIKNKAAAMLSKKAHRNSFIFIISAKREWLARKYNLFKA